MDTLKVMNVVNFVRGCEPRIEVDLVEPIKKQLELLEKKRVEIALSFAVRRAFKKGYDGSVRRMRRQKNRNRRLVRTCSSASRSVRT